MLTTSYARPLTMLILCVVLVRQVAASSTDSLSVDHLLQALHADEIIYDIDTAPGFVRGVGRPTDRPDLPKLEFVCNGPSLILRDRELATQDLYPVPAAFCDHLARAFRQRTKPSGQ
jgi:hypothetical protein